MNLRKLILINNACYKAGRTIKVKGLCVHSTGADNPYLKRYVGPDDGLLGTNKYNNHWNQDKPDGRQVCVHGFIGKLADGSIATYQTLPWNHRGWHGGSGKNGSVNDSHISFEICEGDLDDAAYSNAVYKEAAELCAYLCKEYNLDPMKDGVLICHSEGHRRGIASNHADVTHWWPRHGKSMDDFRAEVKRLLGTQATAPDKPEKPTASVEETIWNYLTAKGLNAFAVAGILCNLYAESALNPTNLQNSFEKKLGMTDAAYTAAVDSGTYANFVRDGAGYGLAQWTYWFRKQALLDFAKAAGKSVGDLGTQLDFLWSELQGYTSVMAALKATTSVRQASDAVLTGYERPADQSDAVKEKRAGYGQGYYDQYAAPAPAPTYETYTVVKGDSLWGIANKKLGNGERYPEIKALNGLTSNTIYAGQVLKLPK